MIGLLRFEVKIQSNASEKRVYGFRLRKTTKPMAQLRWCVRHCCEVESVRLLSAAGSGQSEASGALARAAGIRGLSGLHGWLGLPHPPGCSQAKYIVCCVSWWICTAFARAWGSRPLLCPDTWLPSALWKRRHTHREP